MAELRWELALDAHSTSPSKKMTSLRRKVHVIQKQSSHNFSFSKLQSSSLISYHKPDQWSSHKAIIVLFDISCWLPILCHRPLCSLSSNLIHTWRDMRWFISVALSASDMECCGDHHTRRYPKKIPRHRRQHHREQLGSLHYPPTVFYPRSRHGNMMTNKPTIHMQGDVHRYIVFEAEWLGFRYDGCLLHIGVWLSCGAESSNYTINT